MSSIRNLVLSLWAELCSIERVLASACSVEHASDIDEVIANSLSINQNIESEEWVKIRYVCKLYLNPFIYTSSLMYLIKLRPFYVLVCWLRIFDVKINLILLHLFNIKQKYSCKLFLNWTIDTDMIKLVVFMLPKETETKQL